MKKNDKISAKKLETAKKRCYIMKRNTNINWQEQ